MKLKSAHLSEIKDVSEFLSFIFPVFIAVKWTIKTFAPDLHALQERRKENKKMNGFETILSLSAHCFYIPCNILTSFNSRSSCTTKLL